MFSILKAQTKDQLHMMLKGICILKEFLTNFSFNIKLRNENRSASKSLAIKPGRLSLIPGTQMAEGGKPVGL